MVAKKVAKKKAGNTRIYSVEYVLNKYGITPQQFQDMAQSLKNFSKHIRGTECITLTGLASIGREVKRLAKKKASDLKQAEENAPEIRDLRVCAFKPPNTLKLLCIDTIVVNGEEKEEKVAVNVSRRNHMGIKCGTTITCERISEGQFVHPPYIHE